MSPDIADVVPSKCIKTCVSNTPVNSQRFAALKNGVECHCFEELPMANLTPVPDEACRGAAGCAGDANQYCGASNTLSFFVATCKDGQKRFGDFCYEALPSGAQSIEANFDECSQKVRLKRRSIHFITSPNQTQEVKALWTGVEGNCSIDYGNDTHGQPWVWG